MRQRVPPTIFSTQGQPFCDTGDMQNTEGVTPGKLLYHQMTPAERLADRIARNREMDQRVSTRVQDKPTKKKTEVISARAGAVRGALEQFQQIKRTKGIDAASDYVLSRVKK